MGIKALEDNHYEIKIDPNLIPILIRYIYKKEYVSIACLSTEWFIDYTLSMVFVINFIINLYNMCLNKKIIYFNILKFTFFYTTN